jgi:uncharacterized membrane protein
VLRTFGRLALGAALVFAGIGHFVNAEAFLAQVPLWMPAPEAVVAVSGVIELDLGCRARSSLRGATGAAVGWVVAAFFVVIFPGNISQFVTGTDAFGLDTDAARFVRLLFQPVLVVWALWCTSAWSQWRESRRHIDT